MNETNGAVGKPMDRVDGRLKVTGGAKYAAEFPLPNIAHAVILTSSIAKGRIAKMDTSAADSAPGVVKILTPMNAPRVPSDPGSPGAGAARPQDRKITVLQDDKVYYNNQPIALAIAETLEQAMYAASLIQVEYHEEKPVLDMEREKKNAYKPKAANQEPTDTDRGDFELGNRAANRRVEQIYTTPMENHNPMEPHATTAVWDGDDHLTVYDATQGVFGVQNVLAKIFALPKPNVRCVSYFVGGGFGCKGSVWSHIPLAAMAAKTVNRPVRLSLTRAQMFGMVGYRPRTEQHLLLAAKSDGALTASRHASWSQTSTFDEFVEPTASATRILYESPAQETSHRLVRLNFGTPTYMRAPGESSGTYALETAMGRAGLRAEDGPDPAAPAQLRRSRSRKQEALVEQIAARVLPNGRKEIRMGAAYARAALDARSRWTAAGHGDGDGDLSRAPQRVLGARPAAAGRHSLRSGRHAGHRHRHIHNHDADRGRRARPAAGARAL